MLYFRVNFSPSFDPASFGFKEFEMKTSILSVARNIASTILRFRRVVLLLVVCGAVASVTLMRVSSAAVVPLHLNLNSLADTSDTNAGDGICDTDNATAGEQCTLRAAIEEANASAAADTITFDPTLNLGTISLNTALPDIDSDLIINGPGANLLRIQRSTAG